MTAVATFHWDSSAQTISIVILDNVTLAEHSIAEQFANVTTTHAFAGAIQHFHSELAKYQSLNGHIRYKIAHNNPTNRVPITPHPVTNPLMLAFHSTVTANHAWLIQNQARSPLTGNKKGGALYQFKTALIQLEYIPGGKGNAWYYHLWAIALNATDSNVEDKVKKVWKTFHDIGRMNATHQSSFATWYAAL